MKWNEEKEEEKEMAERRLKKPVMAIVGQAQANKQTVSLTDDGQQWWNEAKEKSEHSSRRSRKRIP